MRPLIQLPELKIDRSIGPWPYLLGMAVIVSSIVLAVYLAYWQSLLELETRGQVIADEILGRTHAMATQIDLANRALLARGDRKPCSESNILLMRRLALSSGYVQAIGYVRKDRLLCSSYGEHGKGIPVGPADYRSRTGHDVRRSVQLPFAGEQSFLLVSHPVNGYAAIALPDLSIDILKHEPDLAMGLVSPSSGKVMVQRGAVQSEWFEGGVPSSGGMWAMRGENLLVLRTSPTFDVAAFAAMPLAMKNAEWLHYSRTLVPLALVAGLALAAVIILLTKRRMALHNLLRQALRRQELFLVYQPIVDLTTGRWTGAEALVRWRRPDGTLIGPDVFIPLAERSALICQVTSAVIRMAMRDTENLFRQHPEFHISLNFSSRDLGDPAVVERLESAAALHGIQPGNLTVEVTERVLIEMEEVSRNVRKLRKSGIRVAIDDFGTGYSGLSYLTRLELDYLKIDKLFVDTIGTDAATSQVVRHIIDIARSQGLGTIAEGVETAEQHQYLKDNGVQYAQGWFYAKPMSIDELMAALHRIGQ